MFKKISEFFRVIGELRYIIPLLRYKWPELDENASLAHTFQETVQIHGEKIFYTLKTKYGHMQKQIKQQICSQINFQMKVLNMEIK